MAASSFIGRDDDRVRLSALVSRAPLVTVTGPGGIGKTRLVREVVRDVADDFVEEVVLADLTRLAPNADAAGVATFLGFTSPAVAGAALAQRSALLVLDNCEPVLDAVARFVAGMLAERHDVRVLATSREPLGVDGEQVMVLAPLALPAGDVDVDASPAVQLFLDRARAAGAPLDHSPATMRAVARLCRRLDGVPLALELAAARTRAVTVADLLATMDRRLDVLRRSSGAGASARHTSMRAAIDVSVDLLDDDERVAFRRLGVFTGPFDVDLAHAVTATGERDRLGTLDLLARLVDRSLVVAERGPRSRFRLLELLREYALGDLRAAGEDDVVHDRFVDAMAAAADAIVVEAVGGWSAALVENISALDQNLRAAIEWAVAHDATPARGYRLLLPLFARVHQSHAADVLALGERVLERWGRARAPWRAEALAVLATAAVVAGDPDRAGVLAAESIADADATEIAFVVAERALGFAHRSAGGYADARVHFARAGQHAAALGAASFACELAGFEASVADLEGRTDEAVAVLDGALDACVQASDAINESWIRLVRSTAHLRRGDWDAARDDVERASAVVRSLEYPWWEGALLRQIAVVEATRSSLLGATAGWDASTEAWRDAVERAVARGSVGDVALTLRSAAVLAAREGRDDVAHALLDAAPYTSELTVLPELFPDDARRLDAHYAARTDRPDLATSLRLAREILAAAPPPADHTIDAGDGRAALEREGDSWRVTYAGRSVHVRHLKGFHDLVALLGRPHVDVHCLELMQAGDVGGTTGPALDDRARREFEERIRDLQVDVDDARAANDLGRAERAEAELDALVASLAEAFGLGGRARPRGAAAERARTAVTYRLRAVRKRLADVHPELARHLDNAIRSGMWCSYRPETDVAWTVST